MATKKPSTQNPNFESPTFLQFWISISERIGNNRLELNPSAKVIDDLFMNEHLYQDHVKSLIRKTLPKKNKTLDQQTDVNQVLDALGESAFMLREDHADDLYEIELLEEIAWQISEQYSHLVKPDENDFAWSKYADTPTSEVTSINHFISKKRSRI